MSESTIDKALYTAKKLWDDTLWIFKERFLSPMYFYFIVAWIITNWKFVYVLLFVNQSDIKIDKLQYMINLYPTDTWYALFRSFCELVLIPAVTSFIAIWWFTILSNIFYEKYERFKQNKKVIDRLLIYEEKVIISKEERKIRDVESDKKDIRYEDHQEFNELYDSDKDNIIVWDYEFLPSEALYNTDYQAYKNEYTKYLWEQIGEWVAKKLKEKWKL